MFSDQLRDFLLYTLCVENYFPLIMAVFEKMCATTRKSSEVTSSTLRSGRLPAVLQFPTLSERDGRFFADPSRIATGVAPTAQSLQVTLWTPSYQLGEGAWEWCTVSQHRDPLSLEKGQWPHAVATYRRHCNTPSWGTPLKRKIGLGSLYRATLC